MMMMMSSRVCFIFLCGTVYASTICTSDYTSLDILLKPHLYVLVRLIWCCPMRRINTHSYKNNQSCRSSIKIRNTFFSQLSYRSIKSRQLHYIFWRQVLKMKTAYIGKCKRLLRQCQCTARKWCDVYGLKPLLWCLLLAMRESHVYAIWCLIEKNAIKCFRI